MASRRFRLYWRWKSKARGGRPTLPLEIRRLIREMSIANPLWGAPRNYPLLRGTALVLDDRNAYLWTNGYLPQLDTYIGPETPNPLFITILRSTRDPPPIEDVLRDIMGLTKINYNACNFNDSLPVTVRFAEKVGDVLSMGSAKGAEKQPFKFYV
jgi:hypothetical protein